ncbi:5,10-methylenetetrahydrofolate reductase [Pirellulimonas nuda]|uniref:Methylenetetrahydrofolate reductase n=1 Tax=Pirellulimonas nuda TaxID=2528009 RepID=A0A518D600_9BACT|nr:methylenetetrahydrofolate reductase [NAD(P)H] [Pirellulimonas nuda]QDU86890.1 5,10-methylenetetrahydrofolate reductase [Pirellulimonas nuda]
MKTLRDAYAGGRFGLSFELFPPKSPAGEAALFHHVGRLVEFEPSFITCTYGAGGSTQQKTLEIVAKVRKDFDLPVATHLTCVGLTADQLRDYLRQAIEAGVLSVVALRGDPPKGETAFTKTAGGFGYANELVAMIRGEFAEMGIAVAGYPEKHLEAPDLATDLANLKRKIDAGADAVITQLFYHNEDFFRFRDACDAAGITTPIVPGLLPVTNFAQIQRITALCGAKLPQPFIDKLSAAGDDDDAQFRAGVEFATEQTQQLIESGVAGIHYYVLNKSEAASEVLRAVTLPA